jgi:hypothetical protein
MMSPAPAPSSPKEPLGRLPKLKLNPSATFGGSPPWPMYNRKLALKLCTGTPASRSLMTIDPCWLFSLFVNRRIGSPLLSASVAEPYRVAPTGGEEKLALKAPARAVDGAKHDSSTERQSEKRRPRGGWQ